MNLIKGLHRYGQTIQHEPKLDRDFLVRLWVDDRKMMSSLEKRLSKSREKRRSYERSYDRTKNVLKQPPPSQPTSGALKPSSPEEVCLAPLLARSNLLITRDIEWANVVLGFGQENRYLVVDVCYPESPVGLIREQSNVIARQGLHRCGQSIRRYGQTIQHEPKLDRYFLVRLWVDDRKLMSSLEKRRSKSREKRGQKVVNYGNHWETDHANQSSFQNPFERFFSASSAVEEISYDRTKNVKQPPPSQPTSGALKPSSPEEVRLAPLLARSNLLITRDIEWANLVFGFEQENRYLVVDVCYPESPVGLIREQSNMIARQFLRTRRPFMAYITDALGNELFRVRRPFWWINSSIYVEIDGKEVGVVHKRWHLWRRNYDLYLGNIQFAVVENPGLWNWTFTLKDINGQVLAQIDRDWRGFGFEIFTDAGQYVIRFGSADASADIGNAGIVQELEVIRPLTLSERAVAVALAVSLDNDYFSRHGGWGIPFVAVGE